MRVLLACEESQAVCIEFRKKGHEAYSCDTQECSGGHPEWHLQCDVRDALKDNWDMIIGFPPCTHLSVAGANLWKKKIESGLMQESFEFVKLIWNACDTVCIENPTGWLNSNWMKATQIINPFNFGDPYKKRTCLWLKNLPRLKHFKEDDLFDKKTHVEPEAYWVNSSSALEKAKENGLKVLHRDPKLRSKTFPGIAKAMADQWS